MTAEILNPAGGHTKTTATTNCSSDGESDSVVLFRLWWRCDVEYGFGFPSLRDLENPFTTHERVLWQLHTVFEFNTARGWEMWFESFLEIVTGFKILFWIRTCVCLSIYPSLSVHMFVCLLLPVCPSIRLSSPCLSIRPVYPSIPSVCLPACLSVCLLSIYLSGSTNFPQELGIQTK